ncbi:16S rRNA (uracil(1498)-N(3))-methyltransferase [Microbacterium pseudoresistens]|uniref:Ribosomal RNA small subunit methyltransferase E n=1 Tax=Microbacterium pseudoresistens TaxID=640634 RepID=A0A7Y9EWN6_9MICO|nr:16S rRNA (uracil(1498)-N(3))-methyltransferase [Microbacterium pseudoresistens]NYD55332.1 16S rRNA (uracil1498-N3)-methyltransferase [Microbacterium pseudoresistens]
MALHFLTPDAATAEVGGLVALTGAEARHAAVVRRLRTGERITLGDGRGIWLEGAAESVAPDLVEVRVDERREVSEPAPRILLAQALAKGDRDELAVQAACELGVDAVVPWQAARSVVRWEGKKAAKGRERWASIVREAAKQAHRAWVPEVAEAETTGQLARRAAEARMLILDPTAETRLSAIDADERDIVLVVGPEGGITPDELDRLSQAGAERVRLGDTVLRTSTAGPAAIAVLSAALRRW